MRTTGPRIPTTTSGSSQRRVENSPTTRPMIAKPMTRAVSTVGPGVVVRDKSTATPRISGQIRTARSTSRRQTGVVSGCSRPVITRIRCT